MKTTTTNMMTDDEDRTRHNISQGIMKWIEDSAPPRLDDDHSIMMKDH